MLGSGASLCEMNGISLELIVYLVDRELRRLLGSNQSDLFSYCWNI
jgi:hypothetical protein